MNLAVGYEAHEVQRPTALFRAFHCVGNGLVSEKLSGFYFVINERYIHAYYPPGPNVQVSDFGISHYTSGQANSCAVRLEQGVRVFLSQLIVVRRCRQGDSVALTRGRVAPTVYDNEGERAPFLIQVDTSEELLSRLTLATFHVTLGLD